MGKAPAKQFYWGDWLNDVELQAACATTRGVWINMLCRMWYSKTRGELTGSPEKLSQICNCTIDEFNVFFKEAETLLFCYASRNGNGTVTVRNRRMFREEKERENNRIRQQRHRGKRKSNTSNNGKVTPPSSSSSSKKESKKKSIPVTELPKWLNKNLWGEFKKHRKSIKRTMTIEAEKRVLNKLEQLIKEGNTQEGVLGQSIENGWIGIFAEKGNGKKENVW